MNKIAHLALIVGSVTNFGIASNVLASNMPTQTKIFNDPRHGMINLRADRNLVKERFIEKLNLNASQQKQMQTIKSKYQPQIRTLRDNISSEREKLAQMMINNESASKLRSQHQKIINLDQKMHNLRFEIMLEMREVLSAEQRQQWAESMENLKARQSRLR